MISAAELQQIAPGLPDPEEKARVLSCLGERFLASGSTRGVTALKTASAIKEEFLLDSLAVVPVLPPQGKVIDIGTGGGIPGLVLAVCCPHLEFVLADSANKKTRWVSEVMEELGLNNIEVVTGRLEALGRDPKLRAGFQAVTAKALASLNVLVEFSLPLLESGGRLIAMKGPALEEEIGTARKALELVGGRVHRCWGYTIGDKVYRLCEVLKVVPTPDKYPRRDGVPQKKPL